MMSLGQGVENAGAAPLNKFILPQQARPPFGPVVHGAETSQVHRRPSIPYITLIAKAILSDHSLKMRLSDMYEYVLDNYPFYRTEDQRRWKNSFRHALSAHPAFLREGARENKGSLWTIHPACLQSFLRGKFDSNQAKAMVTDYNKTLSAIKTDMTPNPATSSKTSDLQTVDKRVSRKRKSPEEAVSEPGELLSALATQSIKEEHPAKRFCGSRESDLALEQSGSGESESRTPSPPDTEAPQVSCPRSSLPPFSSLTSTL